MLCNCGLRRAAMILRPSFAALLCLLAGLAIAIVVACGNPGNEGPTATANPASAVPRSSPTAQAACNPVPAAAVELSAAPGLVPLPLAADPVRGLIVQSVILTVTADFPDLGGRPCPQIALTVARSLQGMGVRTTSAGNADAALAIKLSVKAQSHACRGTPHLGVCWDTATVEGEASLAVQGQQPLVFPVAERYEQYCRTVPNRPEQRLGYRADCLNPSQAPLETVWRVGVYGVLARLWGPTAFDRVAEAADGESVLPAAEALERLGADPVSLLVKGLGDPTAAVRSAAALGLGSLGTPAKAGVPALIALGGDGDPALRAAAAQGLGGIGPAAADGVPVLIRLLAEPGVVRQVAATALGKIGPAAQAAVPALSAASRDKDRDMRWRSVEALGRIGPGAQAALPDLVAALADDDRVVRQNAATALGGLGPGAREAVAALEKALRDPDETVREPAAKTLGLIGPPAVAAVPALVKALLDKFASVRRAAGEALDRIQPGARERDGVAFLIGALSDGNSDTRNAAASALRDIGPGARAAVPALTGALLDGQGGVRAAAAAALGAIGSEASAAVPALLDTVRGDKEGYVRAYAIDALSMIEPEAGKLLPDAVRALGDPDDLVRRDAANALKRFGAAAAAATPALATALSDRDWSVRVAAASALGAIGPQAKPAVPALIQSLSETLDIRQGDRGRFQDELKSATIGALRRITGQDFGSVPEAWQRWWAEHK